MRRFFTFGPAIVVLITAMVTLVAAPAAVRRIGHANTQATIQLARAELDDDHILKAIDRATRAIANSVEPSVVHISVTMTRGRGYAMGGTGSGWVFDADGHIVTNAHVVRDSSRVMVQFQDGRAVRAKVVGVDSSTDVAVLKVDADDGLFPAKRAPDVVLHQGDRVYAFGSPFGFKFSMSEGIVSGLGRDPGQIVGSSGFTNFIQTDAAVNPGNSGGPLVNVEGRVVGMNVAIATSPGLMANGEGQNSGISFAIPVATIESVVEQLITTGVVARGYLGVSRPMSEDQNNRLLNSQNFRGRGVIVTDVPNDGPAAKAGILPGDIVTKINGQDAITVATFRSLIANGVPGESVKVEVWRQGESLAYDVTLATLPPSPPEIRDALRAVEAFGITALGETDKGLEVRALISASSAVRKGIRPDHLITAVDGMEIKTISDLGVALVKRGLLQGRQVSLTIDDGTGQNLIVPMEP